MTDRNTLGRVDVARLPNVYSREIWNEAIEAAINRLEVDYPGHTWVNAYCASIRMLKR